MNRLLFVLPIVIMLSNCKKDENVVVDTEVIEHIGYSTATFNGEEVELQPFANHYDQLTPPLNFSLKRYVVDGSVRFSLSFRGMKLLIEKQTLYNRSDSVRISAASAASLILDTIGKEYDLNEQDDIEDFFQITHYNEETGDLHGIYQLSLYKDPTTEGLPDDPAWPDTLVIKDGYFETVVQYRE